MPEDAPDRMRDQAELQELRHAVAEEFDRHNKDSFCPCPFCRRVVMWVKP
jgi:hypothetical protein